LWLADALLALAIVGGLVFGPEIADRAWAHGIHVTPAQAAMHAALIADGFAHHHGAGAVPAKHASATQGDGPGLQPEGAGSTWGTPLMQAISDLASVMPRSACCSVLPGDQPQPAGADLVPQTPPPEAA
jgi:hypothetical protein